MLSSIVYKGTALQLIYPINVGSILTLLKEFYIGLMLVLSFFYLRRFCGFTISSLFYFICKLAGDSLYDSAVKFQIPDLPAFALECLPNRNSLVYGDIYGIAQEASSIFRGTLRYEGMA